MWRSRKNGGIKRASGIALLSLAIATMVFAPFSSAAVTPKPDTFTVTSWTDPGQSNINDWAPCAGYNHWNITDSPLGTFNGYAYDEAQADVLCSPDTTEHEQEAWVVGSSAFTPSVSGTYYVSAYFSGYVYVWLQQTGGCSNGYGHGFFQIGVAAYAVGHIPSLPSFTWSTIISESSNGDNPCSFNYPAEFSTDVEATYSMSTGYSYDLLGAIHDQDGSYEVWEGNNAQAAVLFSNACFNFDGDCSTAVTLSEIVLT